MNDRCGSCWRLCCGAKDTRSCSPKTADPPSACSSASASMLDVFKMVETVSRTNSTILLTGESGTGKGLVAQAIHFNSLRREKPMVSLNCGAMPENLLESELFGHMRGAFTGADANKKGVLEGS